MIDLIHEKKIPHQVLEDEHTRVDESSIIVTPPMISLPSETCLVFKDATYKLSAGKIDKENIDDTTIIAPQGSHHKPLIQFETTLSVNLFQIKEVFEKVCKKRGFEIVDDEGDQVTAMNKRTLGLTDLIFSCIPGSHQAVDNSTAILLHSKTNKISCMRRVTLKVLLGNLKLANAVFIDFENELQGYDCKRTTISPKPHTVSFFTDHVLMTSPSPKSSKEETKKRKVINLDNDESLISTQNLQTASFYEFRKILSLDQYSIGKKVADFIKGFEERCKINSDSAELAAYMETISILINEVTDIFFADFNYGKSETKTMMPFCRLSVEKFIFDKLYHQLFPMYISKYNDQNQNFQNKIGNILAQDNPLDQLKYLDIPKKFWLINDSKLDQNDDLIAKLEQDRPYQEAIQEMSKIKDMKTPKEKLGALLMMRSLMKSAVVDFHKGKEEISSMDEELPILIYILSQTDVKDCVSEICFIDDYVQLDPSLESEKRLMTNLKVSLQYIVDEWKC